ncbi:MAG TPA: hypothetical protein VND62_09425 [Acidimicrobiales bacterium]|nr:hypothetical protein [Acidimicrobiales bacterium]
MVGACAKYTIYLASGVRHFIALSCTGWPGATHEELWRSITPVAGGLATVAGLVPPESEVFHADGELSVDGVLARASLELLVHTDDALRGLSAQLPALPAHVVAAIMRAEYPDLPDDCGWQALVGATGRTPRQPDSGRSRE